METIFILDAESRARFVERAAAHIPGCAYVCLWAPIAQPSPKYVSVMHAVDLPSSQCESALMCNACVELSSHLVCLDAWLGNGGGDRVRALFDAYRGSLCPVTSGCVPGWAYKDGGAYMEMSESDLATSASLQAQQQFYQEAGIKRAAFMGCRNGEIEIGTSTAAAPNMNLRANVRQVFSEDFVQQSLLDELLQLPPARPTSSSSSLLSLSVESPECSSLVRTMAGTPLVTEAAQEPQPLLPAQPHSLLLRACGLPGHVQFPSPESDDAAMAQAMLAVISSTAPLSSSIPPPPPSTSSAPRLQEPAPRLARRSLRRATAFKSYNAALTPRAGPRPGVPGQRMIKMGMSILRGMYMAREHAVPPPEEAPQRPTSGQLHHMISERRRREKLNESFQALRSLLPPGSKKDKATVLATTREYMNKLIAQISDLEEKNRKLEMQIRRKTDETGQEADDSTERIQVQVTSASSSTSESREMNIRVTVRAECDLSDLVIHILERLKEVGDFVLVSVAAGMRAQETNVLAVQANLTLRVMAGECDETSLKEAVTKVVEDIVTPPPPPADESS